MFEITGQDGVKISIPATRAEDEDYFAAMDSAALTFYREQGYVVIRGCIPDDRCREAISAWAQELKTFDGALYRQTTGLAERNRLNAAGYVMNPLLNLQDLRTSSFPKLRSATLDILCWETVIAALTSLFGEPPKIVQSMYFEGNSATWAHQDTYYLDSERIGTMVGAWFALEDIHPGAGRFFVYPGSHKIDLAKNQGGFDYAFHHDRYKDLVLEAVRAEGLPCRAPALQAGDVLIWNSKTVHGSLPTAVDNRTRQSLTAHYIPDSHAFLQFQSRLKPLKLFRHKGVGVHSPKSQDRIVARAMLAVEAAMPGPYAALKRLAIKFVTR